MGLEPALAGWKRQRQPGGVGGAAAARTIVPAPRRAAAADIRSDALSAPVAAGGADGYGAAVTRPASFADTIAWGGAVAVCATARHTDRLAAIGTAPSGRTRAAVGREANPLGCATTAQQADGVATVGAAPPTFAMAHVGPGVTGAVAAAVGASNVLARLTRVARLARAAAAVTIALAAAQAVGWAARGLRAVRTGPSRRAGARAGDAIGTPGAVVGARARGTVGAHPAEVAVAKPSREARAVAR